MKKVALVEDNLDNRILVGAILEDQFQISEYENASAALKGIPEDLPDLILLDISLPEMDGKDVLVALRKHSDLEKIPIIAFTAHAMEGDREQLLALGFNDYVSKPISDADDFISLLQGHLTGP